MIPFVERRGLWFAISLLIIALGVVAFLTRGFVLGIDFTGGTILERGLPRSVSAQEVREALAKAGMDLGSAVVQPLGDGREVLIRAHALSNEDIRSIDDALRQAYGQVQVRRTELVGPTIGKELVGQSMIAIALACLGVLAYVSVRFQPSQGVAAIIALVHDVLVTLSLFLLLGKEINGPIIAALLTIIGYSINNTIVIFDRIRRICSLARTEKTWFAWSTRAFSRPWRGPSTPASPPCLYCWLCFCSGDDDQGFHLGFVSWPRGRNLFLHFHCRSSLDCLASAAR